MRLMITPCDHPTKITENTVPITVFFLYMKNLLALFICIKTSFHSPTAVFLEDLRTENRGPAQE
jgi:hypothetical protein